MSSGRIAGSAGILAGPLARLVLTAGLLVLGAVALARLPLEYLPRRSYPELTVLLQLGDATDPALVTREWVEEIESAIRSLGRVKEVGGEVRTDGARLTVRFAPGTDPERKAARLESELAGLRRRLVAGTGQPVDHAGRGSGGRAVRHRLAHRFPDRTSGKRPRRRDRRRRWCGSIALHSRGPGSAGLRQPPGGGAGRDTSRRLRLLGGGGGRPRAGAEVLAAAGPRPGPPWRARAPAACTTHRSNRARRRPPRRRRSAVGFA